MAEPAADDGSFILHMVNRLIESCHRFNRALNSTTDSLLAYEHDPVSALQCRVLVQVKLIDVGLTSDEALRLADTWIIAGHYFLVRPLLPQAKFVVGNPPYIRLEDMDSALVSLYRQNYPTMVGRADLYIFFYEAALRQLKSNSACGFICADRWMLNRYGPQLRRFITDYFAVEAVIEVHRPDAFRSEVGAYPAVTVIRSSKQQQATMARVNGTAMSQPTNARS